PASGVDVWVQGAFSNPSPTGLISYRFDLPPDLEFTYLRSDRDPIGKAISGQLHSDLLVLNPPSGPAVWHRYNIYTIRRAAEISARAARSADALISLPAVQLLSVSDVGSGTPQSYPVPIDPSLAQMQAVLEGAGTLTLRRPDGSAVAATDPG